MAADRAALVALYRATVGRGWTNTEHWLSDRPLGEWFGVTTDGSGRVTELNLWDNQLRGAIPPELGSLTGLRALYLDRNDLIGTIPSQLGNLTGLVALGLAGNKLRGEIPASLANLGNLTTLRLAGNDLTGCIPGEIRYVLTNDLFDLGLPVCEFGGTVRSDRDALVKFFHAAGGNEWKDRTNWGSEAPLGEWHGVFTDATGRVVVLNLVDNGLRGTISPELGGLTALIALYLGDNQLRGEIPPEIGRLVNLQQLVLRQNRLEGGIPTELRQLAQLETLYLWDNQLTGGIPAWLGDLTSLKKLSLSENHLQGEIPPELAGLTSLEWLWLGTIDLPAPSLRSLAS